MSEPELAVLDELACSQLFSRLFARLDRFDLEGVARCFTRDGTWDRQGAVLRGPEGVLRALQARSPNLFVQHILHQLACEPGADGRIAGAAYMTVYRKDPPQKITPPLPPQPADMVIRWDVEFAREEGHWRVRRLSNVALYR